MYQGTNPSACASQKRIAEAMMELMVLRPYDGISVAALCRAAGVSRQTFYSLFRSRENVIAYLLQESGHKKPGPFRSLEEMQRTLCRNFSQFVVRKEPVLRMLAGNGLLSALQELLYQAIMRSDYFHGYVRQELQPYAARYVAAGLTGFTEEYLRSGADPDTLEEVAFAMLRGDLYN